MKSDRKKTLLVPYYSLEVPMDNRIEDAVALRAIPHKCVAMMTRTERGVHIATVWPGKPFQGTYSGLIYEDTPEVRKLLGDAPYFEDWFRG